MFGSMFLRFPVAKFGLIALPLAVSACDAGQSLFRSNAVSPDEGAYVRMGLARGAGGSALHDTNHTLVSAQGGYMFTPNFGAEGRLGTSLSDDQVPVGTTTSTIKINTTTALMGRAQVNSDYGISPYVAAGLGSYRAKAENSSGGSATVNETGAAAALGADYHFGEGFAVGAEFGTIAGDLTTFGVQAGYAF